MKKASNYRVALPLLLVAIAAIAFALTAGKSSAQGRTLNGSFDCGTVNGNTVTGCIDIKFGDVEAMGHGASRPPGLWTPVHEVLTLDPGQYWFSLTDDSVMHNFALRSCPGSDSMCGPPPAPNPPDPGVELTGIPDSSPNPVTQKILLKQGWYRLLCQAPFHESGGMYVDIHVVGTDDGGD